MIIIDSSYIKSSCPNNNLDTFTVKISENFGDFNSLFTQKFSSSPNISELIVTPCNSSSSYNYNYNITLTVQDDFTVRIV